MKEKVSGQTHHLLPVPTADIINTEAIIKFADTNPDHRIRINSGALLAAAKVEAGEESFVRLRGD